MKKKMYTVYKYSWNWEYGVLVLRLSVIQLRVFLSPKPFFFFWQTDTFSPKGVHQGASWFYSQPD